METLPDVWRTELFHPLTVHAPLALLVFGTALRLAGMLASRTGRWGFLAPAGQLALVLGVAGAWLAVLTGTQADGVVGRTLCDPTVAKTHEQLALTAAIVFSVAAPVDLLTTWFGARLGATWRRLALGAVALALLAGSGVVAYTGHLGATLVYQQGAAVHHPSPDCAEFE